MGCFALFVDRYGLSVVLICHCFAVDRGFSEKTSGKPLKTFRKPPPNTPKPNFPVQSRFFPGVIPVELPVYRTV
ncbi:MAG: hypothetical protein EBZ53_02645 [Verrucomicrobia bacterium]|nr:hypothetical protein [Verrucomicrobiota bacterium]